MKKIVIGFSFLFVISFFAGSSYAALKQIEHYKQNTVLKDALAKVPMEFKDLTRVSWKPPCYKRNGGFPLKKLSFKSIVKRKSKNLDSCCFCGYEYECAGWGAPTLVANCERLTDEIEGCFVEWICSVTNCKKTAYCSRYTSTGELIDCESATLSNCTELCENTGECEGCGS